MWLTYWKEYKEYIIAIVLICLFYFWIQVFNGWKEKEINENLENVYGKVLRITTQGGVRHIDYVFTVAGVNYYGDGSWDNRFRGCVGTHKCDGMIVKIKYSKKNPEISYMINEE